MGGMLERRTSGASEGMCADVVCLKLNNCVNGISVCLKSLNPCVVLSILVYFYHKVRRKYDIKSPVRPFS